MALVDDEQVVLGEIVEQGERRLPWRTSIDVHRIVFDAVAVAHLGDHLKVVLRAHTQPLRLEQLPLGLEGLQPNLQFCLDPLHRRAHPFVASHVVRRRKNHDFAVLTDRLACQRIDDGDSIDGVTEHLDARHGLFVCRLNLDRVASHAEVSSTQRHVVAVVLQIDEASQDAALVVVDTSVQLEEGPSIFLRISHAVDAAHGGNNDGVTARQKCCRCRMAQTINFIVDRRVLLDERVARGDVGLWLVVVVVAHEILDSVLRKELLHLLSELGSERLVRSKDQRRTLHLFDRPGDRCRLAATGDAKECLELHPLIDATRQRRDGLRLVTSRLVVADDLEALGGHWRMGSPALGPAGSSVRAHSTHSST